MPGKRLWAGVTLSAVCLCGVLAWSQSANSSDTKPTTQTAQERRRVFAFSIVDIPVVLLQASLKLKPEQKTAIADLQAKYKADSAPLVPAEGAALSQANGNRLRDIHTQALNAIQATLTTEQQAKIPGTLRALRLLRLVDIPLPVLAELNLTQEQANVLMDTAAGLRERAHSMSNLMPEERRLQMQQVTREAHIKVWAMLTADQKQFLKRYARDHRQPLSQGEKSA